MKQVYRMLSWLFYYMGDLVYKILVINDDNDTWAKFWYRPYCLMMSWSTGIQESAGFAPLSDADTTGWPWSMAEDEKYEEE